MLQRFNRRNSFIDYKNSCFCILTNQTMEPEEEHLIVIIILIIEIVRDSNATLFRNDFSKDANKLSSEKFIILCVHIYPREI